MVQVCAKQGKPGVSVTEGERETIWRRSAARDRWEVWGPNAVDAGAGARVGQLMVYRKPRTPARLNAERRLRRGQGIRTVCGTGDAEPLFLFALGGGDCSAPSVQRV